MINQDPDPDLDPDPHHLDADPKHCFLGAPDKLLLFFFQKFIEVPIDKEEAAIWRTPLKP